MADQLTPSPADARQFISDKFTDEDLEVFCFDYFPQAQADFAAGMAKGQKILLLLTYCRTRALWPNLAAALQKTRPDQYAQAFGAVGQQAASIEPPQTVARNPRLVFVSHAHQDAEFAHRLAADLRQAGWQIWIAPDSIWPGEKWPSAIGRGLDESGVFLALMTPAASASRWVKHETDVAIDLEHSGEIQLVPLYVQACQVSTLLRTYQRIDFVGDYRRGLAQLLAALKPQSLPPIQVELMPVPAGEFVMGSDPHQDRDAYDDEQPQHRLWLPEYYIGRYPITVAQYEAFVNAAGYKTAAEQQGYSYVWSGSEWQKVEGADWRHPRGPNSDVRSKADHPVNHVSYYDATAFCAWLTSNNTRGWTFELPSEAEWEKAARGTDGRLYPWGNQAPDDARCNFGKRVGDTTPVGRYSPAGDSPYGCADMAGNLWEWTRSLWGTRKDKPDYRYPYHPGDGREASDAGDRVRRIIRGGSWFSSPKFVRCAHRNRLSPNNWDDDYGFRVVVRSHFSSTPAL